MIDKSNVELVGLVRELCKLPAETEWAEFKHNWGKPEAVGEYISALANSAALLGRATAYMVWGISDEEHEVVGTVFNPATKKVKQEELASWLTRQLEPRINFRFHRLDVDGKPVVLLEIDAAARHPVSFMKQRYIRIGSYKKKLSDFPEKERELWGALSRVPFADGVAAESLADEDIIKHLDFPAYFDLLKLPLPPDQAATLDALVNDKLIQRTDGGRWDITNLGAILLAKDLREFPGLEYKALRVIHYKGRGRTVAQREDRFNEGYASGFESMVRHIMALVPASETIAGVFRQNSIMFPEVAVRELLANALIHQDLHATGMEPMVEIFDERMEISNLGRPLVDTDRFVNSQPQSRNEPIASLMHRFNICEKRGSGIGKVISEIEMKQMPAPRFDAEERFTRVTLFARKPLSKMDKSERVRACYLHACLKWANGSFLTNASLRERFGVEGKNRAMVSRYIREAVNAGMIKPYNAEAKKGQMKYMPDWA